MFYSAKINDKLVIKSDLLKAEHFFTTRESFIKTKEPDYTEVVKNNRKEICDYLDIADKNLISPSQTHTANIELAIKDKTEYPEIDGLIVTSSEIAIFLNYADCTPVIFYDECKNIGAVVHAGWRGTAAGISSKALKILTEQYGCNVENIVSVIGPAISRCCYDVGEEVFEKLKSSVFDFAGLSEIRNGKIFMDLKGINARQIQEMGVKRIDIAPYCTCCDNDLFFSYRKENGTTNRHSAILKLKK